MELQDPQRLGTIRPRADSSHCRAAWPRNVRVFGSVARGQADESSDLDLLADLDGGRTLMELGGLLMDLPSQLKMQVDVTTVGMLRSEIRARVLSRGHAFVRDDRARLPAISPELRR